MNKRYKTIPIITYPFTTPSNYSFDSNLIEVVGGVAQLVLQSSGGLMFSEDFADDTDFIYDSDKVEFTGGVVQQIINPLNATFAANYNTDINGTWGAGDLVGVAIGGASVVGGKLDLKGSTIKYLSYDGVSNASSPQVGAIKYKYTPNYSGAPSGSRVFFSITKANGNPDNRIQLTHLNSGVVRLNINDLNGVTVLTGDLGSWTPTLGQEYEFEINYDLTSGATRLFIDGIQFGTTQTTVTTRDTSINLLRIGNSHAGSSDSDAEFDDVLVFDAVQHITNYTPGYVVSDNAYSESAVELPIFEHAALGTISSLDGITTIETGSPRYTFEADASGHLWWSMGAWVPSNGTYAQANDVATVNTKLPTLPIAGNVTFHTHIHFPASSTKSSVDFLEVEHTGDTSYSITDPKISPASTVQADGLINFTSAFTVSGSDLVKFTLEINGTEQYWNGSAWATSDGTYSQTSTEAELLDNLATVPTFQGALRPVAYIHSDDGLTTPEIDDIVIEYDFFGSDLVLPDKCFVFGYLQDSQGSPLAGAEVNVIPNTRLELSVANLVGKRILKTTTRSDGYFEINLVRTEQLGDASLGYHFIFKHKDLYYPVPVIKQIPNAASAAFDTLNNVG